MGREQRRVLEAEKGLLFLNQLIFFSLSLWGRNGIFRLQSPSWDKDGTAINLCAVYSLTLPPHSRFTCLPSARRKESLQSLIRFVSVILPG